MFTKPLPEFYVRLAESCKGGAGGGGIHACGLHGVLNLRKEFFTVSKVIGIDPGTTNSCVTEMEANLEKSGVTRGRRDFSARRGAHFDPAVVDAFDVCETQFREIRKKDG